MNGIIKDNLDDLTILVIEDNIGDFVLIEEVGCGLKLNRFS